MGDDGRPLGRSLVNKVSRIQHATCVPQLIQPPPSTRGPLLGAHYIEEENKTTKILGAESAHPLGRMWQKRKCVPSSTDSKPTSLSQVLTLDACKSIR